MARRRFNDGTRAPLVLDGVDQLGHPAPRLELGQCSRGGTARPRTPAAVAIRLHPGRPPEPTAQPLSAAFVREVRLANSSSVRKALEALQADELVVVRDGSYLVADPFFAAWLRG